MSQFKFIPPGTNVFKPGVQPGIRRIYEIIDSRRLELDRQFNEGLCDEKNITEKSAQIKLCNQILEEILQSIPEEVSQKYKKETTDA